MAWHARPAVDKKKAMSAGQFYPQERSLIKQQASRSERFQRIFLDNKVIVPKLQKQTEWTAAKAA
jgi:hypothetical protein